MRIKFEGNVETIIYVVLGILLAFGINQGLAFALSTDMPVVAVESNSMVPTFHKGDILIIQGVRDPKDYDKFLEVGDVIVFTQSGRQIPIVHRIIRKNPDGTFQTKGDANPGPIVSNNVNEREVKPEQIKGKMLIIIPYLGWVKIGITEYIIPNILIVIPIIIAVTFLYFIAKNIRI
jgi:signal peptidase